MVIRFPYLFSPLYKAKFIKIEKITLNLWDLFVLICLIISSNSKLSC